MVALEEPVEVRDAVVVRVMVVEAVAVFVVIQEAVAQEEAVGLLEGGVLRVAVTVWTGLEVRAAVLVDDGDDCAVRVAVDVRVAERVEVAVREGRTFVSKSKRGPGGSPLSDLASVARKARDMTTRATRRICAPYTL